ncbi:inosine-uridine preferring nucleoside hydrolase [Dactylonectria macrodidyma]|uniref:Inosine-uridine preferring nucleoside hydrolase n=1 Tax=Dactylonectria macrodidyma TaxID=307937 RepID=A0A9P9E080_9HYPO|nr:inosine-uridine preferring nucleoside hydrolase [Dactylonectria macrodidyma]
MPAKNRIIIDTDPGVDDTLAMLLAFASSPQEVEVAMLSVSYGNIPVQGCLKNIVTLFHVIDKELAWRRANGLPGGFDTLEKCQPIVAVGPEHALEEELLVEDGFHGRDGLHGVHEAHPHLTPEDTWKSLFKDGEPEAEALKSFHSLFKPSKTPAHLEILRLLREEPEGTITICVIGPMTNVAMAAAEDPETFLRVKELVIMGGAVDCPGNITPLGEFNTYADAVAAARVFALTSATPASTMPIVPQRMANLPPYPDHLPKQLKLSLFPLDITTPHVIRKDFFFESIAPHRVAGSPLATWVETFMKGTFRQIEKMSGQLSTNPGLQLHDPMTIWYVISQDDPKWEIAQGGPEDIRIETSGQWSHGMLIRDRRGIKRHGGNDSLQEVPGDEFGWLSARRGNRIHRYVSTPGREQFAVLLMERIFGRL